MTMYDRGLNLPPRRICDGCGTQAPDSTDWPEGWERIVAQRFVNGLQVESFQRDYCPKDLGIVESLLVMVYV